jgi:hypothetical protein
VPEATLKFDLSEPDDRHAHRRAVSADDLTLALTDISQALRNQVKYGEGPAVEILDKFRTEFFEILGSHGIDLDRLLQ